MSARIKKDQIVKRTLIKSKFPAGDKPFILTLFSLVIFGIAMVYSATAFFAQGTFGEAYRLIFLHLGWVFIGTLSFIFFYNFDYKILYHLALPIFVISIGTLLILAFFGILPCELDFIFAPCINGANRWFYLNPSPLPAIPMLGVLSFQPSELAKLSTIIYLSMVISKNIKEKTQVFVMYLLIVGLVSVLVILQPNMSTAALIFVVGTVMYFASGAWLLPFFVLIPALSVFGVIAALSSSYRRARILTFLNPSESSDLGSGYHIKQILIALGSGGFFGVGLGQSRQKFQYLPEVSADSIFAIIGEEFGFIGTSLLIVLFCYLIYRGYTISKNAPDLFGRLVGVGITTWIGVQFFVNIAAMTQIIPLTGIPLPLISYGGSSMIFTLAGLGILANISRQAQT